MLNVKSFNVNICRLLLLLTLSVNISMLMLYFIRFDIPVSIRHNIVTNFVFYKNNECLLVELNTRQNCLPLDKVSKQLCLDVGCCWDEQLKDSSIPQCYFSKDVIRYKVTNIFESKYGITGSLALVKKSGLPADVQHLKVSVSFCDKHLLRLKITDVNDSRYKVPLFLDNNSCTSLVEQKAYRAILFANGTFLIERTASHTAIFSTNFSSLIFADQMLQIASSLPSHWIYGLGDHVGSLARSTNWTKYTFFNRDQIPERNWNLYSSFPFYMVMEEDGSCHGVYLFNSNAMDVILQPQPAITFRTIGGILEFFIFLGPSPNHVVQQLTKLVGYPVMPPYWSLGFHLCRLGYFTLNKTVEVWKRTVDSGIPFDVQWNDIDYMDKYNDFTFDEENFTGLPEFVDHLHNIGMHYVLIIDPGISSAEKPGTYKPFDDGLALDLFIKNSSGQLLKTKVWNKISSVFPDFTHPSAALYWKTQLLNFHSIIKFDGVWLDMNEPTNFLNGSFEGCPENSSFEHPPYTPGYDSLYTKTLCMSARHYHSLHYNLHNIYGIYETEATHKAMIDIRKKRPFVLTRAGFPGIGKFAAMWNGDVISIWEHMRASIPSMLTFSMVGIPNMGADICGFNDNTTVELCARWFSLGAFYPFSRNHNSDENIEQDPVALGPIVIDSAKSALTTRYLLLPYLYTLIHFSHSRGDSVVRPLFFEYPQDIASYRCDSQFFWGPSLMIIPVLEPDMKTVSAYLPPDIWYDFYMGNKLVSTGENFTLDAPLGKINLVVRSGYILPGQEPNTTTTLSRRNKFLLLVALNDEGRSSGQLYWDDGDSLDVDISNEYNFISFDAKENRLVSSLLHVGYVADMILGNIKVFGVSHIPQKVLVNGKNSSFYYQEELNVLEIVNLSVSLLRPIIVEW